MIAAGKPCADAVSEPQLVAAPRDASAYNRPDVRSPKVAHVARPAEPSPINGCLTLYAMCSGALLNEDVMYHSLDKVPEIVRCQRRACANHWPERQP